MRRKEYRNKPRVRAWRKSEARNRANTWKDFPMRKSAEVTKRREGGEWAGEAEDTEPAMGREEEDEERMADG